MNIKEIGDEFLCDCGFSWSRGKNGNHNCANGLREKVRQLAAENVGLKKFIQTDCFVGHLESETFYEEEVTRYVSADGYEPETPATDRIYAEAEARGVEKAIECIVQTITPNHETILKELAQQLRKGSK
ncbi:hypothetical protein L4N02_27110 [Klebsiella variicola]|uniref:hypothetical protein n=1 Tax=Klebsiella variicola TaxID=244366 RepID=UPI001F42FA77|nr:hypothetical protein [Klebsiella variicola]MCF7065512.1 hypothetical protein [Klebsiella variicola]MCF7098380.1 hypothetical protein [Klebsiella variicola]